MKSYLSLIALKYRSIEHMFSGLFTSRIRTQSVPVNCPPEASPRWLGALGERGARGSLAGPAKGTGREVSWLRNGNTCWEVQCESWARVRLGSIAAALLPACECQASRYEKGSATATLRGTWTGTAARQTERGPWRKEVLFPVTHSPAKMTAFRTASSGPSSRH